MKRLIVIAVVLAIGGSTAIAQVVPINGLKADTERGWVKIDKSPKSPGHQRVYCITLDGYPSCDWNDVRRVVPDVSHISKTD